MGAKYVLASIATATLHDGPGYAHGGGRNAEGRHNDRKNGGYHRHRGSPASTARQPLPLLGGGGAAYANCAAARAAGAAPVRRGSPTYDPRLDSDVMESGANSGPLQV